MKSVSASDLSSLVVAKRGSHKGQNGKLMVIGGSHLFHSASIWAFEVASRIVDLVHYSSVSENNDIVMSMKKQFRNGIIVSRSDIETYIEEDDCILIGPGMMRSDDMKALRVERRISGIGDINAIEDEGVQTAVLTHYLLTRYPQKQWVLDAGALQMLDLATIPKNSILTPHHGEFATLWRKHLASGGTHQEDDVADEDKVKRFAQQYRCVVVLKGHVDLVSNGAETKRIEGGNEGMTKGGTGDVLAGLIAALACTNNPMESAIAGSYINKKAGEKLYESVGPFFNASDLAVQIPKTMRDLLF